ncbi:MAG TPA: hypothetical protein VFV50_01150 [Bdellovibrionales bacterium]|nr:hypothetical protein [Bdellovibrionales bacterium]
MGGFLGIRFALLNEWVWWRCGGFPSGGWVGGGAKTFLLADGLVAVRGLSFWRMGWVAVRGLSFWRMGWWWCGDLPSGGWGGGGAKTFLLADGVVALTLAQENFLGTAFEKLLTYFLLAILASTKICLNP